MAKEKFIEHSFNRASLELIETADASGVRADQRERGRSMARGSLPATAIISRGAK
jgi:hypothetical protein